MRITLSKTANCGAVELAAGDYWVSLNADSSQIFLIAGGRDFKLPATRRRVKVRTKSTTVSFYSGGGDLWSLVVTSPKLGEWISLIEYKRD